MTPLNVRQTALKVGAHAITTAATALHTVAGVQDNADEEQIPLLPTFSSTSSAAASDTSLSDVDSQASSQWDAWIREELERESDLESLRSNVSGVPRPPARTVDRNASPRRLGQAAYTNSSNKRVKVHKVVIVEPPHVARSECASIHDASELSDDEEELALEDVREPSRESAQVSSAIHTEPLQRPSVRPAFHTPIYEHMREQRSGYFHAEPTLQIYYQPPPPTYEQRTGVMRSKSAESIKTLLEKVTAGDCSLQRRRALRRRSNPLFARPKLQDFQKHRATW